MGGRFALLIATCAYEDEGLQQLTAPGHDAEALAEVLRDPDIAGFEVTTLVNRPHHEVGSAIGDFFRARSHDDLTLLYFTGHGLKDDDGRLHLATVNTRLANRTFTSLPAEQIDQAMTACMSRRQVLILDCCYSGAFPAGRLAKGDTDVHALERFQGQGRTVLTASDAAQHAFEGDRLHGSAPRSVFTKHLVQGLRDGSADLDGDGDITLDELYAYVHGKVVAEMPQQRPKKQENIEGRTVIAQNVNWALPAQLQNALQSPLATQRLGGVEQLAHLYRIGNVTVRARAAEQLRLLADDDSRTVSAAAATVGETAGHPPNIAAGPAEIQDLIDQATEERDAGAPEQAEERYWSALDLAIEHRARRQEGWAWGPPLRFVRASRADAGATSTGDDPQVLRVTVDNKSELAAVAGTVHGPLGGRATVRIGARNNGPGALTSAVKVVFTVPEGTTVVASPYSAERDEEVIDQDCRAVAADGTPLAEASARQPSARRYVCTARVEAVGATTTFPFTVRIDKDSAGGSGQVTVSDGDPGHPSGDPEPTDDTADVAVSVWPGPAWATPGFYIAVAVGVPLFTLAVALYVWRRRLSAATTR